MHRFRLRVSGCRLKKIGTGMKKAENDADLQVLRQSLSLAFGKTSLLVEMDLPGSHKLFNSKVCELAC